MTFFEGDPINPLTRKIIGAAITVHRALGPGLLESAYEACLTAELRIIGLEVERQVVVPVTYRDIELECGYRMDMLVEREVVVEAKVVAKLIPIHVSQVLTYLRLAELRVGLLFNFNVDALVAGGMKRVLNGASARDAGSGPRLTPLPPPPRSPP